jgi:hypothetical protein
MTGSNLRAGLREFKVLVFSERVESWRVLATDATMPGRTTKTASSKNRLSSSPRFWR